MEFRGRVKCLGMVREEWRVVRVGIGRVEFEVSEEIGSRI